MTSRHVALALLFPLASCASIMSPGPDLVLASSNPPGATVYLDDVMIGTTPTTASIERDAEGEFRFELPGHKTVVVDRDKVLNGWFLPGGVALVLFPVAFLVSLGVDLSFSNQGKYSTTPLSVEMPIGDPMEIVGQVPKP